MALLGRAVPTWATSLLPTRALPCTTAGAVIDTGLARTGAVGSAAERDFLKPPALAIVRAVMLLSMRLRVRTRLDPVAPSRAVPPAYHWVLTFVGCGDYADGVSVRVWPTSATPWIVGAAVRWNVPGATGAVASDA